MSSLHLCGCSTGKRLLAVLGVLAALVATPSANAVTLLSEDFEAATLGPVVTLQSEIREREAWTDDPTVLAGLPGGWTADDSAVPTAGNPLVGVAEFEGWSLVNKDWWVQTAGGQRREEFVFGSGVVAVADPDEWDDFAAPGQDDPQDFGFFDAKLTTSAIALGGATPNTVRASFSSSWRDEAFDDGDDNLNNQTATITAIYDVGEPIEVLRWDSDETSPFFKDDAPNEAVALDLQNPAGATSVQLEFRLFDALNDWWWAFDNLQVFTGATPPADQVLRAIIDRDTQDVKIVNNTGEVVQLRGYSLTSNAGVFDEAAAAFLADGDSDWLQATIVGDEPNDLSEVHLSEFAMASGSAGDIEFGPVWRKYFEDEQDVAFEYLVAGSNDPVQGLIEFTGNGDESFEFLDLNFDGTVDILDWDTFKAGFGTSLTGLTDAQRHALADISDVTGNPVTDGEHTFQDFFQFQLLFDQVNGSGSFALAVAGVPEPSSLALIAVAAVGFVNRRRLPTRGAAMLVAAIGLAVTFGATEAQAQIKLLEEDFEGVALAPPIEEETETFSGTPDVVSRTGPAGWTVDNSGTPGLTPEPTDPETDGVIDFGGWTYVNRLWWEQIEQDRDDFTRGTGTILVADSDEWDDDPNAVDSAALIPGTSSDATFNTVLSLPTITNIPFGLIPENGIKLAFDSSWRDEFDGPDGKGNQTAVITASYDGGEAFEVLRWVSDPEDANFKDDATNERVFIDLDYDGSATSLDLEFSLLNADNDWWWGIDNLLVQVPAEPSILRINASTGDAELIGGDVIPTDIKTIDIQSANGNLTGTTGGLSSVLTDTVDGGDDPGEQWEVLTSSEERLFEAFLFGDSTFDASRTELLAGLFDPTTPEAERDITFQYSLATGDIVTGVVEFVGGGPVEGDFNGDGRVDNTDLNLLLNNWGSESVPGEWTNGFIGPRVDNNELNPLLNNWGFGTGTAVPEPTTVALLAIAAVGLLGARSRRAGAVAVVAIAAGAGVGTADAQPPTPHVDRQYSFGEFDGGSAASPTPKTDGDRVTSVAPGTRDTAGVIGAQDRTNLEVKLSPTFIPPKYVDVTRPDGVTGVGIALNQQDFIPDPQNPGGFLFEDHYLEGEQLNWPQQSFSSNASLVVERAPGVPLPPNDYTFIRDRGFEIWAKPTAINGRHDIVMDSNQHGVFIDENGFYAMRYAGEDYSSPIPAQVDTWAHLSVVRPFEGGNGSILWVDGVAGAAAVGDYAIEALVPRDPDNGDFTLVVTDLDEAPLVVGGSTGQLAAERGNNVFEGVVDDLEMFVMGFNDTDDFGEYVFERDNDFAAFAKPPTQGDLTGDPSVTFADAQIFASNWRFTNLLEWIEPTEAGPGIERSLVVGDLASRDRGDFNYDGVVDLADWAILNTENPAVAAFAMSLITGVVPEPGTLVLACFAATAVVARRR
ncbi:MAG: PEP-CTERM sorting domain-containing protein [Planctomycetota bacterium]